MHHIILQLPKYINIHGKIILFFAMFLANTSLVNAQVEYADSGLIQIQNKEVERTYDNVKSLQNEYSVVEGELEIAKAELDDIAEELAKLNKLYAMFWNAAKEGEPAILRKVEKTAIKKKNVNESFNIKKIEVDKITRQVLEHKQIIANAIVENNQAKSKEKITFELVVTQQVSIALAKIEKPVLVQMSATAICSKKESLISCENRVKRLAEQRAIDLGAQKVVNTMTEVRNFQLEKDDIVNSINAKLTNEVILKSQLVKASPLTYVVELSVKVAPVRSRFIKNEVRKSIITELSAYRFIGDSF